MGDDTQSNTRVRSDKFFSNYPLRRYKKRDILIFAQEPPSHIFYLVGGYVRQYDITEKGDEAVVNTFKPPSFFPMGYVINRHTNEYFYDAADDVTVRIAPVDDVYQFVKSNLDVTFDLLERVYSGMDGILRRQVYLMSGNTTKRLVYELFVCCIRMGEQRPQGGYLIRLTEVELAARLGMTRETVSRHLQELKRKGLVKVVPSGLIVTNIQKLKSFSEISKLT